MLSEFKRIKFYSPDMRKLEIGTHNLVRTLYQLSFQVEDDICFV